MASNNRLTSLEGGPEEVGALYDCGNNLLKSIKGGPRSVRTFRCVQNPLTSLEGLPEIVHRRVIVPWTSTLPLLRLVAYQNIILYDGEYAMYSDSQYIIRKHCSSDKSTLRQRILACQKELIDNGFEDNASW